MMKFRDTSEEVAYLIFKDHPDLPTDGRGEEFFSVAFAYVAQILGSKKSAHHLLSYDEDFPSDLISDYAWYQKKWH